MHRFAKPGQFLRYSAKCLPWLAALCVLTLAGGLYGGLFLAPPDYQQGEAVRILYVHVPAAWMSLFIYTSIAICSGMYLIWKHPLADVLARSSAPVGAVMTLATLLTGALWGQPMWGAPWVWDARLTSELILFFLYLGYIFLADSFEEEEKGRKAAAILALVGFVNIPVIKFSVEWWNSVHQPASILRVGGPTIHFSMLWPLLLMILAFTLFYACVLILRARADIYESRISRLQAQVVSAKIPRSF